MAKLRAVLFDVDGVLLDSTRANAAFYGELFRRAGGLGPNEAEMAKHNHLSVESMLRKTFPERSDDQIDALLQHANTIRVGRELLTLPIGVNQIIPELASQYKLGLVTNHLRESVGALWDLSGLQKYFSAIAAYEDTDRHKPDPEPVHYALEKLGVLPEEALFIGDAETDLRAGQEAGVNVLLISKTEIPGAVATIKTFTAIPATIGQLKNSHYS